MLRTRLEVFVGGRRVKVVDVHGHFIEPEELDVIKDTNLTGNIRSPLSWTEDLRGSCRGLPALVSRSYGCDMRCSDERELRQQEAPQGCGISSPKWAPARSCMARTCRSTGPLRIGVSVHAVSASSARCPPRRPQPPAHRPGCAGSRRPHRAPSGSRVRARVTRSARCCRRVRSRHPPRAAGCD